MSKGRVINNNWSYAASVAAALPLVVYLIADFYLGGRAEVFRMYGQFSQYIFLAAFIGLIVSIIAIFRVTGKKKVIPIAGVIVNIFVASFAFLAYSLSVY